MEDFEKVAMHYDEDGIPPLFNAMPHTSHRTEEVFEDSMAPVRSSPPPSACGHTLPKEAGLLERLPRPQPTHGGNNIVEPTRWALTIKQFNDFLDTCKLTALWQSTKVQPNHVVTGYALCKTFVKPWTAGTGCGVALLLNNEVPIEADVMVSHSWGEDMTEAQLALNSAKIPEAMAVWFCIYANYQCGDGAGPSVPEQLARDPFESVIKLPNLKMMAILFTTTDDPYGRLWCVFEIDAALTARIPIRGCFSSQYRRDMWFSVFAKAHAGEPGVAEFLQVNTATAKCNPKDEPGIRKKVEAHGGFTRLDARIRHVRREILLHNSR